MSNPKWAKNGLESETFYPLTREQLDVSGVPVLRLQIDEPRRKSDCQSASCDSSCDKKEESKAVSQVASRWENEDWAQMGESSVGTKKAEKNQKKTPQKYSYQETFTAKPSVPEYQKSSQPVETTPVQQEPVQHTSSNHPEPQTNYSVGNARSFLSQLSDADFGQPSTDPARTKARSPHFLKKLSHQERNAPVDQTVEACDQNLEAIRNRLQHSDLTNRSPDVSFPKPENDPEAISAEDYESEQRKLPYWAEVGINATLGVVLVFVVIGFHSYLSNSSSGNPADTENVRTSQSSSVRIAEK